MPVTSTPPYTVYDTCNWATRRTLNAARRAMRTIAITPANELGVLLNLLSANAVEQLWLAWAIMMTSQALPHDQLPAPIQLAKASLFTCSDRIPASITMRARLAAALLKVADPENRSDWQDAAGFIKRVLSDEFAPSTTAQALSELSLVAGDILLALQDDRQTSPLPRNCHRLTEIRANIQLGNMGELFRSLADARTTPSEQVWIMAAIARSTRTLNISQMSVLSRFAGELISSEEVHSSVKRGLQRVIRGRQGQFYPDLVSWAKSWKHQA